MYELNILVNGNRCKQYHHDGKIFIEAKQNSEYSLEIKNNTYQRILAVGSVDGLNVIDGNTATTNSPGYIIDPYSSIKIDGFRISNNEVSKFVFDYKNKNNSYAASKEDGSEVNVGAIGIMVFLEKKKYDYTYSYTTNKVPVKAVTSESDVDYILDQIQKKIKGPKIPPCLKKPVLDFQLGSYCSNIPTFCPSPQEGNMLKGMGFGTVSSANDEQYDYNWETKEYSREASFDMATKWGDVKESKVTHVNFDKEDSPVSVMPIYYASRQSLIDMGVPITTEKKISFPEAFPTQYATPPKGWKRKINK